MGITASNSTSSLNFYEVFDSNESERNDYKVQDKKCRVYVSIKKLERGRLSAATGKLHSRNYLISPVHSMSE